MAKRKPRRKFRRYLKGLIEINRALGTLATSALITSTTELVTETCWLSSVRAAYSWKDITTAASDGPIVIGLAHDDYTDQEIEDWLEVAGSWDAGNMVTQEIRKRKIRLVGTFPSPAAATATGTVVLNDGKPITTKCGWYLVEGSGVNLWIYNIGSGNLLTGSFVGMTGHANLWPR